MALFILKNLRLNLRFAWCHRTLKALSCRSLCTIMPTTEYGNGAATT